MSNEKKYKKGRSYYGTLSVNVDELIPNEDTDFEGMVELAVKKLLQQNNLNESIAGNGISVFVDEETNMDPEEDLYADDC